MEELKVGDRVSYTLYDAKIESVIAQIKTTSKKGFPLPVAIAVLRNGTSLPVVRLLKV